MSVNQTPVGIQVVLDPGTWQWLQMSVWVAVGLTIAVIASVIFHLITEFRTPLESKAIRNASHGRKSGAFLISDDGVADFKAAARTGSEGYIETKKEGKFKFYHTAFTPRPGTVSSEINVTPGGEKDLAKTRALAERINRLNTTKVFLRGARIPIWFGVYSKGLLASAYAIAGLQLTEILEKATIEAGQVFPIDVTALKQMVTKASYNESQINALASDHEHIGEERAKKGEGLQKIIVIFGIVMVIVGAVMLAIAGLI